MTPRDSTEAAPTDGGALALGCVGAVIVAVIVVALALTILGAVVWTIAAAWSAGSA